MPVSLRRLFCTLLVYCNPVNAKSIWEEFRSSLSEDFLGPGAVSKTSAYKRALRDIAYHLELMGKNINDYGLTDEEILFDDCEEMSKEIVDELNLSVDPQDILNIEKLNAHHREAFDLIMSRVETNQPSYFFVDGPRGTGKSFLYNCLLAKIRSRNYVALATASSGVAASIKKGGRTTHSLFKIPIDLDEHTSCAIKKQSGLPCLIRSSKLIIWDEAHMVRRQGIESFEQMLQDICSCSLPFGGKLIVFGGDFRQVLPVIPKASAYDTIQASLVKSPLWHCLTKIKPTLNMRSRLDGEFTSYLLNVGNGTVLHDENNFSSIPRSLALPYQGPESLKKLIDMTFPDLSNYSTSPDTIINRAILSTTNEIINDINETILEGFPSELYEYRSFDRATEKSKMGLQEDFYNSLTPSGYPLHILKLKVNCPLMLLRNIDPSRGLCNETRLICKTFSRNIIGAEIASGSFKEKHVFLPRIPITPAQAELDAFPFCRTQFPIRLCFCMTINKAQGQTLDFVGLYLPQPVFSHCQLYVALSRARDAKSIAILVGPPTVDITAPVLTANVVYKEILSLAAIH